MRGTIYKAAITLIALSLTLGASAMAQRASTTAPSSSATVSAMTGGPASLPPAIRDAYQSMDNALNHRDASRLAQFYTGNAVLFNAKGAVSKVSSVLPIVRQSITKAQSIASNTTIQDVNVQPDGTTVTFQQIITETEIDQKTGVLNTTVVRIHERDHWVQAGGSWKINRVRVLTATEQLNGANIAPGATV